MTEGTERKKISPEERNRRRHLRRMNDRRKAMSTVEGRRLIYDILEFCGMFHSGYVPGDSGYGTTFLAGKREPGISLTAELMEACPERYFQMLNEHASEAKRQENEFYEEIEEKNILDVNT